MDIEKAIRDLYAEKERLEKVIASLEDLQKKSMTKPAASPQRTRRGRKSMGSKERLQVSERMKKYWARRRSEQGDDTSEQDS
jgi:hypothetical protein